ncbi:universal stress protein [Salinisphaera hydrothermalis]|uniref:Universal stress protein F n=1 Tax=Salinisphaera hydrothermalis (strain C41B8) TaxID=1304275 RepID=A0A084IN88_SALHC|nr:universal stress protein [Salinisphaera hydrothermalis]KEZ78172.1 Universal stress protein F [Salinisphaera hydrothermalis C41B8]
MSQTLLVPLDLNQESAFESIFAAVKRIADSKNTRVILLTVIPEISVGVLPFIGLDEMNNLGRVARVQLERLAEQELGDAVAWEIEVRIGPVPRTIVSRGEHYNVDMIIMASHNPVYWDVLLGSTAAQVVRHSRRSILIVRQPGDKPAHINDVSRDALML